MTGTEDVNDQSGQGTLRRFLVDRYDVLLRILTRRLGSSDLASDTLHDTYVRLEHSPNIGPVSNPLGYLLRMATNVEGARLLVEKRRSTVVDQDAVLAAADDAPDPEQVASGIFEWERLLRALDQVPARRRDIFLAAWVDDEPYEELARRYNVGIRTIQLEVKRAFEHCLLIMERTN